MASLPLRGCQLNPSLDQRHPLAFRLLRNGQEVAVLEVSCPPGEARLSCLAVLLHTPRVPLCAGPVL